MVWDGWLDGWVSSGVFWKKKKKTTTKNPKKNQHIFLIFIFNRSLKARVESVTKSIEKVGKMTTEIRRSLHAARNINEVEHLVSTGSITCIVETLYNTINFCRSTHKRHSIARPKGRGMGCLLWVQRATYCVDLSILSFIKYLL